MDLGVIVMADRGPRDRPETGLSPNHRELEGQSVLFADGRVGWMEPAVAGGDVFGYDHNNIYTADKWELKDGKPKLISNGSATTTPTDPNGKNDSVLYYYWGSARE